MMNRERPAGIHDTLTSDLLNPHWKPFTVGVGVLEPSDSGLRCVLEPANARQYSDAQITDYQGLARRDFPWSPPLRLCVRAWASHHTHDLKGTAGFGFWNEPFVPVGRRWPRLPRSLWFFFASPPNNMALAKGVAGYGWKAATIDATRWPFLTLLPLAPIGFLLMRIPVLYRALWPVGQRALGVSEALLPVTLAEPHTYELTWLPASVTFQVDGKPVLVSSSAPRGPLGFIAWMDNQYAVVTPQGRFRFGRLATSERQWLTLKEIEIRPL
jgi:hypothetical protein